MAALRKCGAQLARRNGSDSGGQALSCPSFRPVDARKASQLPVALPHNFPAFLSLASNIVLDTIIAIPNILHSALVLRSPTLIRSSEAGHWTNKPRSGSGDLNTSSSAPIRFSGAGPAGFHRSAWITRKPTWSLRTAAASSGQPPSHAAAFLRLQAQGGRFAPRPGTSLPRPGHPVTGRWDVRPLNPSCYLHLQIPPPSAGFQKAPTTTAAVPSFRPTCPAASSRLRASEKPGFKRGEALPARFHRFGQHGNGRHKHAAP